MESRERESQHPFAFDISGIQKYRKKGDRKNTRSLTREKEREETKNICEKNKRKERRGRGNVCSWRDGNDTMYCRGRERRRERKNKGGKISFMAQNHFVALSLSLVIDKTA